MTQTSKATGRWRGLAFVTVAFAGIALAIPVLASVMTFTPQADGTLADGGGYGPFDGVADDWDWTFNESSYEGAITLNKDPASVSVEHRVVFEYNLSTVAASPPLTARLTVLLRGAPRFPASDTEVQVFTYPADLMEQPVDFEAEPTSLVGSVRIAPYQPPTYRTFDVSSEVSEVLLRGLRRVAFRFQVNPATKELTSQAFIDALDSEPLSKPVLTIDAAVPGDADRDQDVDLDDFRRFSTCFGGPGMNTSQGCTALDFDLDADMDLADFDAFQYYRAFFIP